MLAKYSISVAFDHGTLGDAVTEALTTMNSDHHHKLMKTIVSHQASQGI